MTGCIDVTWTWHKTSLLQCTIQTFIAICSNFIFFILRRMKRFLILFIKPFNPLNRLAPHNRNYVCIRLSVSLFLSNIHIFCRFVHPCGIKIPAQLLCLKISYKTNKIKPNFFSKFNAILQKAIFILLLYQLGWLVI